MMRGMGIRSELLFTGYRANPGRTSEVATRLLKYSLQKDLRRLFLSIRALPLSAGPTAKPEVCIARCKYFLHSSCLFLLLSFL